MLKLWYETPAMEWTQALPLGNGHMGAMAYGGAAGRFDLSENTCWSGAPQEKYLADQAGEDMRQARMLLTRQNVEEAEILLNRCCGIKENYGTQLPMGRIFAGICLEPLHGLRELDLVTGVATDTLTCETGVVRRESFLSNPHQVMCIRLSGQAGECLPQLRIWVEGWSQPSKTEWIGKDLVVKGRALENIHSDGLHGVSYSMRLRMETDGTLSWSRKGLLVDQATSLVICLAAATDMFNQDPDGQCRMRLDKVQPLSWDAILAAHMAEHAAWMNRCSLTLPSGPSSSLPTDRRIAAYGEDPSDQALVALFFQYGRYLLLNSSRPDSVLPAALQGVWNDDRACRMGWTDDMHLDINTQMNYYPAEVTGLSACSKPLFSWIRDALMPNGQMIAQQLYGSPGWVAHTVSNARGWAAPGWEGCSWAFHVTGGGWISTHIWSHYLYTKDLAFLEEYYGVLYGAAQFLLSILTEDPETGELVTNPSYSPENAYLLNGKAHTMTTGATIDTVVTKVVFQAVIKSAEVLAREDDFVQTLKAALVRLPDFKIGRHGQLQEWNADFEEALPDHRHTSHLLALHPFNLIDPERSPMLASAVRTSISRRLGGNAKDIVLANWAGALLILYHARLLDGEAAMDFVRPMITFLSRANMMITHEGPTASITGGIYELDGNTGFTAGVTEMLLQSHAGEIHILPAIPSGFRQGECTGLIAQGGHRVDVKWDPVTIEVIVCGGCDGSLVIHCGEVRKTVQVQRDQKILVTFQPPHIG